MVPKRKSSDAGNSDMPKRSRKVLPSSEKVKVLDLIRKEKKSYAEVAKIYVRIPLHHILSCSKSSKEDRVTLNFTKYSSNNEMVLAKQIIQGKPDLIRMFHEEVDIKIKESTASRPRRLLVFINPFAGNKKGLSIFNQIKPIFDCAKVKYETVVTTETGSAKKLIMELKELYSYDGVVSVGGDGTINDIVNGLMLRCQSDLQLDFDNPTNDQMPCLLPIGIIPAGTYNALVRFLHETCDPITAALHIILGRLEKSNVYSIHQNGKLSTYAALFMGIGITANAMKTSDNLRCLGRSRYILGLLINMLRKHELLKLKFTYKKARPASTEGVCNSEQVHSRYKEWKIIEGEFHSIDSFLMTMEENGSKIDFSFGDNYCQMMLVRECSRKDHFDFLKFLKKHKSRAFNYSFVDCVKFKAARIELLDELDLETNPLILTSDGEVLDITSNHIDLKLHPRAISIFGCRK